VVELARGLGSFDQIDEALAVVDNALDMADRNGERWCVAELLHVRGQLLLRDGTSRDASLAEAHYLQSLCVSRKQGAAFWELRTATSLARLWQEQSRTVEARNLLAPMCERFSRDVYIGLKLARRCLDDICGTAPRPELRGPELLDVAIGNRVA
jgi:predicted ATPase